MDRAFNIVQVYHCFTIYKQYFLLKFELFSWISYTTLFKIRSYHNLVEISWSLHNGSQIFLGTSQKYGLVKYERLLSKKWCGGETIR
jgi:hypothetical protein